MAWVDARISTLVINPQNTFPRQVTSFLFSFSFEENRPSASPKSWRWGLRLFSCETQWAPIFLFCHVIFLNSKIMDKLLVQWPVVFQLGAKQIERKKNLPQPQSLLLSLSCRWNRNGAGRRNVLSGWELVSWASSHCRFLWSRYNSLKSRALKWKCWQNF